jgi:hypothetical protein
MHYTYMYIVDDRSNRLKVIAKVPGSLHQNDGRSNRLVTINFAWICALYRRVYCRSRSNGLKVNKKVPGSLHLNDGRSNR